MRTKFSFNILPILGFIALSVAFSQPSYAYIDPGSGSYFAQMLIASIASFMLFVVKPLTTDIKHLFKRLFKKEEPTPQKNDVE